VRCCADAGCGNPPRHRSQTREATSSERNDFRK
jgi:hypothetical protein